MAGEVEEHEIEDVTETVENGTEVELENDASPEKQERVLRLPITRIKTIIKTDSDVTIASHDAVVLIAKATELFIQELAKEAYNFTMQGKRKTLQHRDLELAIDGVDELAFLEAEALMPASQLSYSNNEQWTRDRSTCVYNYLRVRA